MSKFFVPFEDDTPVVVDIKGHRLLLLSSTSDDVCIDKDLLGYSEIREIDLDEDDTEALAALADGVNAGAVLAPPGTRMSDMIEQLEDELPWVH